MALVRTEQAQQIFRPNTTSSEIVPIMRLLTANSILLNRDSDCLVFYIDKRFIPDLKQTKLFNKKDTRNITFYFFEEPLKE